MFSLLFLLCLSIFIIRPSWGREKDAVQYGAGLIVNIPFPEDEVVRAVQDVVQSGLIRGTREYNKDQFVSGAAAVPSSRFFPPWTAGGKVFYKERLHAIDPRNFKDSGDVGTLAVRYVVQPQDDTHTVLHIDAVFVEDFRRVSHASNGSVESEEYKDIHDHIEAAELMKEQTAEAVRDNQRRANPAHPEWSSSTGQSAASDSSGAAAQAGNDPAAQDADSSEPESLEQRVHRLRGLVERRVRAPGAPLKSAPFQTASTIQLLTTGTEVLIVISSPYWYGIETHDGAHGWISRDNLEAVP